MVRLFLVALAACLLPQCAYAGTASVTGTTAGVTPFLANVAATYTGTLQSVSYEILPKSGSVTRPFMASYAAQYLASTGAMNSGSSVTVPVFGLYAGYTNTVYMYFYFTDGTQSAQTVTFTTAAYTDPCSQMNLPSLTQSRANTSDLNYDFFILKDICSANDPAILDTDGNIRWVGQANDGTSAVALYNNAIYLSDNHTGVLQMQLTTDAVTKIGDYAAAPYNVTYTGHHNIDPGRDGLILDVNTSSETEAVNLEINPLTGAVLNSWDLGQIISAAMTAGGDNPSTFVLGTSADWFHNNATAYNPADNTLIVSSRENFVIAVDYDTPADGQKKIHWILGDNSKTWYTYPSLRAFALTPTNSSTLPPIGQHSVSIDHNNNLLLFDDGLQSLNQSPAGISRTYSAVREYVINDAALTATAGSVYYSPNPTIYNNICGSVYDVQGTYLVDFPVAPASNGSQVILQGLGATENLSFNLQYPGNTYCNGGWNAYPIPFKIFQFPGTTATPSFNISAVPYSLSLVAPQSGQVAVSITQQNGFTGSVALTATGFPAGVTYAFTGAGATSGATLSIAAGAGTPSGSYPITITGTSGTLVSSFTLLLQVASSSGFTLSDSPGSLSLTPGSSNSSTVAINPANGFTGSVTFAATGLPAGVTAMFATNPATTSSLVTLTAATTAAPGTSIVTITGTSGSLVVTTPLSVTVGSAGAVSVNMAPSFNIYGIFNDGTPVTNGGFDNAYYAYSSNLLGTSLTRNGVPFNFGQPGQPDATSSATVTLPAGKFNALNFLGAANFGAQANQAFVVQYTDGTTSTFSQSLSDWGFPQGYAGETTASSMAYREAPGGATQGGPWNLYGYSFALDSTKTVQGIVLPPSRNVVVLAITLSLTSSQNIAFPAIASQAVGGTVSLTATASSGLPVSFASSTTPVCTVSGTTATLIAAGTCTITASQPGSASYAAATPVTQSFTVSASSQTITFGAIPAQTVGTSFTLSARASSGLPVSFASSTTPVCTVSGTTATLVAAGTCTITASQPGNGTYAAAAPVSQSFNVAGKGTFTVAVSATRVIVTPPFCFAFGCFGGASGKDTVTITPVNGFTGTVTFSVSGLPAGVTAAFSPTSVAGKGATTLTLTAAATAARNGSTTLTIVSSSGSGASLITVPITITLSY